MFITLNESHEFMALAEEIQELVGLDRGQRVLVEDVDEPSRSKRSVGSRDEGWHGEVETLAFPDAHPNTRLHIKPYSNPGTVPRGENELLVIDTPTAFEDPL